MKKQFSFLLMASISLFFGVASADAVTEDVSYGYGGDPVSCDMHADPGMIAPNGATTLIWYTSDNVVKATLHPKNSSSWMQDVPLEGWWWISGIVDSRTYTLTVEGEDGQTASCDAAIVVNAGEEEDPSCELYADPDVISAGGGTTLVWDSSDNAISAVLHPKNSTSWMQGVPLDGSWWISGITDSRTYSLTVKTAGGRTATCDAPITVIADEGQEEGEAPTCEISAAPDTILAGGGTTLLWDSSENVVSAVLHPTGSTSYFAEVTPSGSWWISGIVDSRSYSVTVRTADGQTATCDAPISVLQGGGDR